MKKLVYILTATIVPLLSIAQQEAMFTHYMFNMMESNSARIRHESQCSFHYWN